MNRLANPLILSVYIPTALLGFAQGLLTPILPLYARELGGSYSAAGFAVAAAWIGTTIADVPTGMLLSRIGFRRSMLIGAGMFTLATIATALAFGIPDLIVYRLIAGVGTALWGLSRHTYIAQIIAPAERGRVIAMFGGISRFGYLGGPAIGGLIANWFGLASSVLVAGLLAAAAFLVAFVFVHDPKTVVRAPAAGRLLDPRVLREALAVNRRDFAAASATQIFAQLIRQGRQITIPLFAAYGIGLDPAQVGQIVSLSSVADVSMFMPAGIIMDRYGRKAAVIPSFLLMAVGMALIPFTNSFLTLLAAAFIVGLGNGLSSGTMMTLGADLAPPHRIGEFLGIWRVVGDSGNAMAPLVAGTIADLIGITLTAGVIAILGVMAAGTMWLFVRETNETRPARARPAGTPPARPAGAGSEGGKLDD